MSGAALCSKPMSVHYNITRSDLINTNSKYSGQGNQTVRYVHSDSKVATLIKMITNKLNYSRIFCQTKPCQVDSGTT